MAGLLLLLLGCASRGSVYVPNMSSVPLLRERGDWQATIGTRDAQLAYAPTSGVTVFAAGMFERLETFGRGGDTTTSRAWLLEAGAGPHGALVFEDVRWEVLGGAGYTHASGELRMPGGNRAWGGDSLRLFLQPAVGFVTPWVEFSGSVRLSGVQFVALTTAGFSDDQLAEADLVRSRVLGSVWGYVEPSLTLKAGYKWVKLYLQRGWSFALLPGSPPATRDVLSAGVSLNLAQWFRDSRE